MISRLVAALAIVGLGLSLTFADETKPAPAKPDPVALAKLVARLGSERFEDREAACDALDALGPSAMEALRKALTSADLETHRRAVDLLERIEKRQETAELTQPKSVRLVYSDTPVAQAAQDFARKTGFTIQLDGDQTKLANRKITLDTGDVPFWQAVDQFCEKAGLVERGSVAIAENNNQPTEQSGYASRVVYYAEDGRSPRSEMPLVLLDGKPPTMATHYGGAVRVRILPRAVQSGGAPKNPERGTLLTVEISPEPKMGLRSILSVRVERVIDDQGAELKAPPPFIYDSENISDYDARMGLVNTIYTDGMGQRGELSTRVPLRFQVPEGVKKLKEVHGFVAAEVLTAPAPLLTMDNILDAAGKTVEGKTGGALKVSEVKRDDKGQVTLKIILDRPPMPLPRGGFGGRARFARRGGLMVDEQPNASGAAGRILSLIDEKGQAFKLTATEQKVDPQNPAIVEFQLTFQPTDGAAKPAKLVYLGRRKTTIDVPFVLKDVPVP
jgi:hypothetical protein